LTQAERPSASGGQAKTEPLLEIRDLAVTFDMPGGETVRAVDGLDLTVHPRQTVALVGESGCGKSVTALSMLQLIPSPPGRIERGSVRFAGRDLLRCSDRQMLAVRGGEIAMIFQEPLTSLNPVYTIGAQVIEAIHLHQRPGRKAARRLAIDAMREVGIPDPETALTAYPHEFSGGMCQRAMTAMALACQPRLLLADEPTTALDVTTQAQILGLLKELQQRTGMSIVLITHDLGVVAQSADVVCVMHGGRIMEYATAHELFTKPLHPYTRGLFTSIPQLGVRRHRLLTVSELMADPAEFRKLPGYKYGIVPWWSDAQPPEEMTSTQEAATPAASANGTAGYRLFEVEPGHWVACWRTKYVDEHPVSHPNLDDRRADHAAATPIAQGDRA